jgi:hypothetical protein
MAADKKRQRPPRDLHRFPIPAIEVDQMVEGRLGLRGREENDSGWFVSSTYDH